MGNEGYIKLYRRMMKWGWYTDTPTKCVFLHLLFLACYEPCYFKGVRLEAGQVVASVKQISIDTGVSVRSVRTALEHLKSTNELTQESHNKFSVFTINNYADYQGCDKQADKQLTNNRQTTDKHSYIKKNKEDKEDTPYTPQGVDDGFARFWTSYPKKVGKKKAQEIFAKLKPEESTLQAMLASLACQKQSDQWQRDGGQYIPHPATWLNQRRWEDEDAQPPAPPKKRRPVFDRQYTLEERLNGANPVVVGWEEVE